MAKVALRFGCAKQSKKSWKVSINYILSLITLFNLRLVSELPDFDTELPLNKIKETSINKTSDVGAVTKRGGRFSDPLTVETAVFLDPTAYRY